MCNEYPRMTSLSQCGVDCYTSYTGSDVTPNTDCNLSLTAILPFCLCQCASGLEIVTLLCKETYIFVSYHHSCQITYIIPS